MEHKLTLKEKRYIKLTLQKAKLKIETDNPKLHPVFVEDIILQSTAKTQIAKSFPIVMTYATKEIRKMFA